MNLKLNNLLVLTRAGLMIFLLNLWMLVFTTMYGGIIFIAFVIRKQKKSLYYQSDSEATFFD